MNSTPPGTLADLRAPDAGLDGQAAERARLNAELDRLGLTRYATELDVQGYTVVPPSVTGMTGDFIDEVRETALDLIGKQTGTRPDPAGESRRGHATPGLYYSLMQARVFEQLLMQEHGLAMAGHLLGEDFTLLITILFLNGPAEPRPGSSLQLPLHTGLTGLKIPEPFPHPSHGLMADIGWMLTDYGQDEGCTVMVPGSHYYGRGPFAGEAEDRAEIITAPKGSMLVWHGATWHGGHPRSIPGLRGLITHAFSRPYIRPLQPYYEDATEEMLTRNPARFSSLLGYDLQMGSREQDLYEYLTQREQAKARRHPTS